jgi:hypothetical protein
MPTEPVIVNSYGDTAQAVLPPLNWKRDYLLYLAARCDAHVQAWLWRQ